MIILGILGVTITAFAVACVIAAYEISNENDENIFEDTVKEN